MMWYGESPGWGGWLVMSLGMVAVWSLVVLVVVALVRGLSDDRNVHAGGAGARQLLDERLARGDIDADDYKVRRDLLNAGR